MHIRLKRTWLQRYQEKTHQKLPSTEGVTRPGWMIRQTFFENVCKEGGITNASESLVKNEIILKKFGLLLKLLRSKTCQFRGQPLLNSANAHACCVCTILQFLCHLQMGKRNNSKKVSLKWVFTRPQNKEQPAPGADRRISYHLKF